MFCQLTVRKKKKKKKSETLCLYAKVGTKMYSNVSKGWISKRKKRGRKMETYILGGGGEEEGASKQRREGPVNQSPNHSNNQRQYLQE